MNTKQAKDFLVQETANQAALENVPLSDLEKRMMYFTESDASSCNNPVELNDEFEARYDTAEYESKISRLLHHAYKRLKSRDLEGKRNWGQAVGTLRRGDHYFLVLWDRKPPSEHRVRDSLALLGTALLIVTGIIVAAILAAKFNVDIDRFRKYFVFLVVGLFLLAGGVFRLIYRLAVVWFHRGAQGDSDAN